MTNFSPYNYSMMLVDLPTDLLHSESARLSNEQNKTVGEIASGQNRPQSMLNTLATKIQLIDLEIERRAIVEKIKNNG